MRDMNGEPKALHLSLRRIPYFLAMALLGLALGLASIMSSGSTPVLAHANLLRSEPEANSVLDRPPDRIIIWFTEPIEPRFSQIQVLNPQGRQVDLGDSSLDPSDPTVMTVSLEPLDNGTYTVAWRNLSTVDGHTVRSSFIFSVGEPLGAAALAEPVAQPILRSPLEPVLRWGLLISALSAVGGLGFHLLVSRPVLRGRGSNQSLEELAASLEGRIWKLVLLSAGAFLIFSLGQLLLQASVVLDIPVYQSLGPPAYAILFDTNWGVLWLWRIGLLAGLAATLAAMHPGLPWNRKSAESRWESQWFWLPALGLGMAMLFTISLTSHGAATVQIRTGALFSDYLHLLAAAIWVGGLFHLAAGIPLILGASPAGQLRRVLSALVPRFSVVALLSVGILVATGLYGTWAQVTVLDGLVTPYGWTLLAKVGVVAVLLALGAINLLWVRPRISSEDGAASWLRRLVSAEVAVALVVLLLVGLMASLEPARQVASRSVAEKQEQIYFQDTVEGLNIDLAVEPGKAGPNQITVTLEDRQGRPVTNASEVRLGLAYVDTDLGGSSSVAVQAEPGVYVVSDEVLSLVGNWQVELVVRRPDNFDARTAFRFPVTGGASGPGEEITPSADLGKLLWGVELGLIGLLFVVMGIPLGGWYKPRGAAVMGTGLAAFLVGAILVFNTNLAGGGSTEVLNNPFPPNPESLALGQEAYSRTCQACHGGTGVGNGPLAAGLDPPPADLIVHVPLHFDNVIFGFVRNGIPDTAMEPAGDALTDEEIWHIINYIKTFEEVER